MRPALFRGQASHRLRDRAQPVAPVALGAGSEQDKPRAAINAEGAAAVPLPHVSGGVVLKTSGALVLRPLGGSNCPQPKSRGRNQHFFMREVPPAAGIGWTGAAGGLSVGSFKTHEHSAHIFTSRAQAGKRCHRPHNWGGTGPVAIREAVALPTDPRRISLRVGRRRASHSRSYAATSLATWAGYQTCDRTHEARTPAASPAT